MKTNAYAVLTEGWAKTSMQLPASELKAMHEKLNSAGISTTEVMLAVVTAIENGDITVELSPEGRQFPKNNRLSRVMSLTNEPDSYRVRIRDRAGRVINSTPYSSNLFNIK